jgi:hypothetical protein
VQRIAEDEEVPEQPGQEDEGEGQEPRRGLAGPEPERTEARRGEDQPGGEEDAVRPHQGEEP